MRQVSRFQLSKPFAPEALVGKALPAHFAVLYQGARNQLLIGWDALETITANTDGAFEELQQAIIATPDWWLGHFSYDLKNQLEALESNHFDGVGFPLLSFFRPRVLVKVHGVEVELHHVNEPAHVLEEVQNLLFAESEPNTNAESAVPALRPRHTKGDYLERIRGLQEHIHKGNIYEINFCQEFYAQSATLEPAAVFARLDARTKAPFACYLKHDQAHLMCGSPERFMAKTGQRVFSQPIKGTIRRGSTVEEDRALMHQLANDPKERSENVMIVDLVRNDLSITAARGTVTVEELCGIHTFETVHQMISTVACQLREGVHGVEAIKAAFPMGSMTGAPKIRAMELSESFEATKRGLYSGAVGYFTPNGDFDFNVVIRSIQYQESTGYVSMMVGGAITAKANPENEYQECLLKAEALFASLGVPAVTS